MCTICMTAHFGLQPLVAFEDLRIEQRGCSILYSQTGFITFMMVLIDMFTTVSQGFLMLLKGD